MRSEKGHNLLLGLACLAGLIFAGVSFSQDVSKIPETPLPEKILRAILNEVSGQLAFNNEVALAGYEQIRTEEEFKGFFHEAEYLAKKLKDYGVDEVKLENLGEKEASRGGWWVGLDAELSMVQPEEKRLSRLEEHPALMSRNSDEGDWEGEVVFIEKRDIPKVKEMDLTGKIVLTPEYPYFSGQAFEKGALGIISYFSPAKPLYDPFQVGFDMRLDKGKTKNKVFGFNIWPQLGQQLQDLIFSGQKIVLKAGAKTATIPGKLDTVMATIKGTAPDKKGFMFTAHLFERPQKQGANDNVSGCVVLTEIARTLTKLIREGKIERPERSIYFVMGDEGNSTMAFFKKYPEMADKILGAINMDMVGENLDLNYAFFGIEVPTYSKTSFVESVAKNLANYVFLTNVDKHGYEGRTPWVYFPVPIVEKNGTTQAFKFLVNPYEGGSDHSVFMEAEPDISALSFNVWPDLWYHTDHDRPDKSDPTQLKRVAFIGAASALAICSGNEEVLKNLVRATYEDRLDFIKDTVVRSVREISHLSGGDNGGAYQNAVRNIQESIRLARVALAKIKDLSGNSKKVEAYLDSVAKSVLALSAPYTGQVKIHYLAVAQLNGFKPVFLKSSAEELALDKMIPAKVKPVKLGDRTPFMEISGALQKHPDIQKAVFEKYGYGYLLELFASVDGKKSLGQIRTTLSLEFQPVPAAEFLSHAKALEEAGLIKLPKK